MGRQPRGGRQRFRQPRHVADGVARADQPDDQGSDASDHRSTHRGSHDDAGLSSGHRSAQADGAPQDEPSQGPVRGAGGGVQRWARVPELYPVDVLVGHSAAVEPCARVVEHEVGAVEAAAPAQDQLDAADPVGVGLALHVGQRPAPGR